MTARKCFLSILDSSNSVLAIDGVTGEVSVDEFHHIGDLGGLYQHPDMDKVWLRMNGDGARVATYLGDGQIGDPSADYSPAVIDSWTDYPNSNETEFGKGYRVGRNVFLFMNTENDTYLNNGFTLKNGAGNTIFTCPSSYATFSESSYFPIPALAPVGNFNINGVNAGPNWSDGGYYIQGMWFDGNSMFGVQQFQHQTTAAFHNVLLRWDIDTNTNMYVVADATDLGERGSDPSVVGALFYVKDNGDVVIRNSSWTISLFESGALSHTNVDLQTYLDNSTFYDLGQLVALLSKESTVVKFGIDGMSPVLYEDLRTQGALIITVDRNMGLTEIRSAPLSDLDEYTAAQMNSASNNIEFSDDRMVVLIGPVIPDLIDGGKVFLTKGAIIDARDIGSPITQVIFDLATISELGQSPLATFDFDSVQPVQKQAYEVTGVITLDGSSAETEVMLVDNATDHVLGRTKSDPVTGAYKFRCWKPGVKSVLAKHPVSGGWRLAAERIPAAVG